MCVRERERERERERGGGGVECGPLKDPYKVKSLVYSSGYTPVK